MKTHKNLFKNFCSIENLRLAFKKARKRKTLKPYVKEFEKNLDRNLKILHEELLNKKYSPLPLKTFILHDPKTRKISVSDFRDRVIHHAVCNILEPIFEKYFIYDSYANRKNKGNLVALKRFDKFKRKVSRNGKKIGKVTDNNLVTGFVLKADIRHYFDTVDHVKLLGLLTCRIKDPDFIEIIKKIIYHHSSRIHGKGMPLGNMTSQFFANVYLNELDHFVKQKLKVKYYVRYVDDFIILHYSRHQLEEWKEQINNFLKLELLLELHPLKSKVCQLGSGVDFLGFKCFYHFRLLRKRNIIKMFRKLERFKERLYQKAISCTGVLTSLQGWNAYAMHANTYKLRKKILNQVNVMIETIALKPHKK